MLCLFAMMGEAPRYFMAAGRGSAAAATASPKRDSCQKLNGS